MSDQSQGPGWWRASDEKWYPPESRPSFDPSSGSTAPSPAVHAAAEPSPVRPWWVRRVPLWALLLVAVGSLLLGFAAGSDPDSDETAIDNANSSDDDTSTTTSNRDTTTTERSRTTTTKATTTTTRPTTTTVAARDGTRERPFALTTPLSTDVMTVQVNSVNLNGNGPVAAANQFNDPPAPGNRFVLVNLTVTNEGTEPLMPWIAVEVGAVGSQNQHHTDCSAVLPDDLDDAPELFTDGTASGNVCIEVPEAEINDGSLLLTVSQRFGGDPVFLALK